MNEKTGDVIDIFTYRWGYGKRFEFDQFLKNTFDGLILGDASYIECGKLSAYLNMKIVDRNSDWIYGIVDKLNERNIKHRVDRHKGKKRISKGNIINEKPSISIRTLAYRNLLNERKRWYPKKIKIVPKDIDISSPVLLANWYMGDGSLTIFRNHISRVSMFTNSFTKKDVEWISKQLKEKLAIKSCVLKARPGQFIIVMSRKHADKFLDIVRPYITSSFSYKVNESGRWKQPRCITCGQLIDDELNFKKYCDVHIPKKVLILRKSRNSNNTHNIRRKYRRIVGQKNRSIELIVEAERFLSEDNQVLSDRAALARERKELRNMNKKLLDDMVKTHDWPTEEKLRAWVDITSLSQIAKKIGVSVQTLFLKCKKLSIETKPAGFWSGKIYIKSNDLS